MRVIVELLERELLRELPEYARRPFDPGVRIARLQAKLLRPASADCWSWCSASRSSQNPAACECRSRRAADTRSKAPSGWSRRSRSRAPGARAERVRPADRLVVREVVARALVRVGLVAMVVGAVRDEAHVLKIDLHLERRQVVLVRNRNELGRRVVEAARARIGVGRPVRRRSCCCLFWNITLGVTLTLSVGSSQQGKRPPSCSRSSRCSQ